MKIIEQGKSARKHPQYRHVKANWPVNQLLAFKKRTLMKKKLLITVGAGASLDFGMPSVSDIDKLFNKFANDNFSLTTGSNKNLYSFIRDEINSYYQKCPKSGLRKSVNFEEVLYQILLLCGSLGDNYFYNASNALFLTKKLPNVNHFGKEHPVDSNILRHLASHLVDSLLGEFINRCDQIKKDKKTELLKLESFLSTLTDQFDIGIISLNYDNIFTQAKPDLNTGFTKGSGIFDLQTVTNDSTWNFIYHLHGSVHFSMEGDSLNMHAIKWNDKPSKNHKTESAGRNTQDSTEGTPYLTSPIIAGYGKTNQILRPPFRSYYSQIDRLVLEADSYLFLGYGFNDLHLNSAFSTIRSRQRPVVIIDWANDNQDPLQFRHDIWSENLFRTIPTNGSEMSFGNYSIPADIGELKRNKDFEISKNPKYPLAVWYSGVLDAYNNDSKVITKLS